MVITSRVGATEPEIDIIEVAAEVGDVAHVVLIQTGDLTRQLSDLVPERLQVYGGAARSYPTGPDALADSARSKLRFAHDNPQRATAELITDALGHAQAAGLFEQPPASARTVTGTVDGFLLGGSRALVQLDSGGMATVWQELTYPPIPLEWTLSAGQTIAGVLDEKTRRLNVELNTPTLNELAAAYPHGSVTVALVQQVDSTSARLALHPQRPITIARSDISANPLDRLDSLLSEGDVVAARVVHLSTGRLHLRLSDVDDDETVLPALTIVDGGMPWLNEDRPLVAPQAELGPVQIFTAVDIEPVSLVPTAPVSTSTAGEVLGENRTIAPVGPRPGPGLMRVVAASSSLPEAPIDQVQTVQPGSPRTALQSTQLALTAAQSKVVRLEQQLADVGASDSQLEQLRERVSTMQLQWSEVRVENATMAADLKSLREERRSIKDMLRKTRRSSAAVPESGGYASRRDQWADAASWLRHEIYLAWVDRVAPGERSEWALPSGFEIGDGFADSLGPLEDSQSSKAFKAVVDVLTGRVKELSSRRLHPLRHGDGACEANVVRADGARCMRASIEQNVPAARRLHYWVLEGGDIELSRVVTHDDMEP